ncbi:MAG TPA: hypothetical protein VL443_10360 [Cyclobacteriaceae bacterium]|jgi:hypothetical protein|nr:hypothetical protein [Cyclobacteriaceae bacterium]
MKLNYLTRITFVLALISLSMFTHANAQEWVELGSRKVNFGLDKDVIEVSYTGGTFTAIKLEVTDGALNMHRCVVHFQNGTKQEVELRHNFAKGSESRVIDLNGNKRFIKKIDFWYDSKDLQFKRATLIAYGRK